jgi:glycosyltransferase involved in cell wall biosynthesis
MRLIVAFDTWILSPTRRCDGCYVYAKRLLKEFADLLRENPSVQVRPFVARDGRNDAKQLTASSGFRPIESESLASSSYWWWLASAQMSSRKEKADLLFSPTVRSFPLGLVPTVTTIADVTPLKIPEMIKRRGLTDRVFLSIAPRLSNRIITVSESSKKDIVEQFNISPDKISVTYEAADISLFNAEAADPARQAEVFQHLDIRRPFLFHHGSVHIRKNLVRLIEAYSQTLAKHRELDVDLVLAGANAWGHEEIMAAAMRVKRGRVIFTGAISDEGLALVLKGATAVVIPSLYEGFCLPMVEAMACGIPTIASNNSCLPEVSGNVLRYFDPLSVEDMANGIEQVLCDSALRQELSIAGIRRSSEFSWRRCARQTLQVLTDAYQEVTGREVDRKHVDSVTARPKVAKG